MLEFKSIQVFLKLLLGISSRISFGSPLPAFEIKVDSIQSGCNEIGLSRQRSMEPTALQKAGELLAQGIPLSEGQARLLIREEPERRHRRFS